jgi:outer membrane receptor protein involved in Fe transport
LTAYATYSTGFRTPSANARAGQVSAIDPNDIVIPFGADSDELKNYELGLKGTFADGKLLANIAAYQIDWSDIQVQVNRLSDTVQFATNIGEARSRGLEFELTAYPTPNLMLGINGSWNDAKVTDLTDEEAAISGAVEGAQLAFPELQGSLFLKYDFDLSANREGFFTANASYVGSYPNMFPNAPGQPGVPAPTYDENESYSIVNMTLGTRWNDKFTVTAYVENLLDNDSYIYVHPEAFLESRYGIPRPRTAGLRVLYNY